jgi:galactokinase
VPYCRKTEDMGMATIAEIKKGMLHPLYEKLYGKRYDTAEKDQRMIHLLMEHERIFGKNDATLFSTAGRSELGGNHTDHNLGRVLAATINLDTIAAAGKRDDMMVILSSEGYPDVRVDISDLSVKNEEKNRTEALVRGIAKAFQDKGVKVHGWEANTTSGVLKGSGLSSSAAIEVLCGTIFNHFYASDKLTPLEIAQIGQYAENVYFGKPSGLLDQIACAYGGIVAIDFKDAKHPLIEPVDINFQEFGYDLVIVDTKGNHANLTGEYAAVPQEMRAVAHVFGKEQLRDVDPDLFYKNIAKVRKEVENDRAVLRAFHFFADTERVAEMIKALKAKEIKRYLDLVNESGNSSFCFLQNAYAIGNPAEQSVPLALALSKEILHGEGACRVHGGGFGGTIQAYVPHKMLDEYTRAMEEVFGKGSLTLIAIRSISTCALAD